jgi:hypothetical protein
LAELCAAAAIGGHFDTKHVHKHVVHRLFASACILLDKFEICDTDYLRVMRVLLCFAVYSCLEKHLSARAFISGLIFFFFFFKYSDCDLTGYRRRIKHCKMEVSSACERRGDG